MKKRYNIEELNFQSKLSERKNISRGRILLLTLVTVVVVFVASAAIFVYTPILSQLNLSKYGGYVSRSFIIDNLNKIDSLRYEIEVWRYYNKNIMDIIAGNKPEIVSDSVRIYVSENASELSSVASQYEEMLRKKAIADKRYEQKEGSLSYNFYPPISGIISTPFERSNNGGVTITVYEPKEVLAINDGTVIAAYFSPETGNVIQLQHSDNMVSTYNFLSKSQKSVGDKVIAGEVIGYVGDDTVSEEAAKTARSYKLLFELWHNGNMVNPENYIVF